jgi:hypothetical protein
VDGPELDAPTVPSESYVAQDAQTCSQTTTACSEEWETVRKKKKGTKQHFSPTKGLPAETSYSPTQPVSAKGKEVATSADANGNRRRHKAAAGMLTRSSVQRNSNMSSGSSGKSPTIPHP